MALCVLFQIIDSTASLVCSMRKFLSFIPPAGRQRRTAQHQWIGVAVYPEGQATGLSEALPANLSDSYRLDAQAEET